MEKREAQRKELQKREADRRGQEAKSRSGIAENIKSSDIDPYDEIIHGGGIYNSPSKD